MKASLSKPLPARTRAGRSGKRHWFRITGLPGWKRAQLGMPAFGEAECVPHLPPTSRRACERVYGRKAHEQAERLILKTANMNTTDPKP